MRMEQGENKSIFTATMISVTLHFVAACIVFGTISGARVSPEEKHSAGVESVTIIRPDANVPVKKRVVRESKRYESIPKNKTMNDKGSKGYPLGAGKRMTGEKGDGRPVKYGRPGGDGNRKVRLNIPGSGGKDAGGGDAAENVDPDIAFLRRMKGKLDDSGKEESRNRESVDWKREETKGDDYTQVGRMMIDRGSGGSAVRTMRKSSAKVGIGEEAGGGMGSNTVGSGSAKGSTGEGSGGRGSGEGGRLDGERKGDGSGAAGGGRGGTGGGDGTGSGGGGNGKGGDGIVCPDDMVFIPGSKGMDNFCIDRYEYPNRAGGTPKMGVSYAEAARLCERAGKRLCTGEEWVAACSGVKKTPYPYGAVYIDGKCNSGSNGLGSASGRYRGCVSDYHVYDMVGNVWEWVEEQNGGVDVRGGSYNENVGSNCTLKKKSAGAAMDDFGFRCCY